MVVACVGVNFSLSSLQNGRCSRRIRERIGQIIAMRSLKCATDMFHDY